LEGDSGVIQSPGYSETGGKYPKMVKCTWNIKSSAPIRLVFMNPFELNSGDSLKVSDVFGIY